MEGQKSINLFSHNSILIERGKIRLLLLQNVFVLVQTAYGNTAEKLSEMSNCRDFFLLFLFSCIWRKLEDVEDLLMIPQLDGYECAVIPSRL